ncbi:PREDICTED: putative inactive serine/threonine-protein kinase At5g11400 isoform X2 [Camelina sativa]|uniref:Inactive serine/threonine-protein kinase At5g11400 isoform X2 n=1 Tax=Camelina sativa TaxID=90675 RepID=A0ABM0XW48_CAMSA|nr:PREDICTED: putative inactive serine/threonine-protein kinase At5g11400 isoform X2 [Camelina sativa]
MGNIVKPFKQQQPFAYQPLTVPLISVEAQNEDLRVFRFTDLKKATKNFRQDRVETCEDGSVRKYYRGYVHKTTFAPSRNGKGIAVSVMECDSVCPLQDWMARARSLQHISHPNLVKLLGYCCEDNKTLFLVFEYSHKGSLDSHIFGKEDALPWVIRVKIAIGIAQGVAFLHSINKFPLNQELQKHNIMLEEHYNAKLFYLESIKPSLMTVGQVMVIPGYVSPECVMAAHMGMESDVYLFGLILLELLSGSNHRKLLIKIMQSSDVWNTSILPDHYMIEEIIDPRLGTDYPANAAIQMGTLIQRCTKRDKKKRPLMQQVLDVLDYISEIED